MVSPAAGLVVRDGVGRAAQGAGTPHVAVARVVQSQLETQPEPVVRIANGTSSQLGVVMITWITEQGPR